MNRSTWPPESLVCQDKDHRDQWEVVQYHCNFSAFNGYRYTPSAYSLVRCRVCHKRWRTKAAYVETLPQARQEAL